MPRISRGRDAAVLAGKGRRRGQRCSGSRPVKSAMRPGRIQQERRRGLGLRSIAKLTPSDQGARSRANALLTFTLPGEVSIRGRSAPASSHRQQPVEAAAVGNLRLTWRTAPLADTLDLALHHQAGSARGPEQMSGRVRRHRPALDLECPVLARLHGLVDEHLEAVAGATARRSSPGSKGSAHSYGVSIADRGQQLDRDVAKGSF